MFGRPAARAREIPLAFPEKGFALVALLAFAQGRRLDRDTIRELLWENAPADRRAGNLRQLLLRLNRLAPGFPVVEAVEDTLRLATESWRVDAVELLAGDPRDLDAKALDFGSLLEGIAAEGQGFEEWLRPARRQVNERRIAVLRATLDDASLGAGDRIDLAGRLVGCDPLDEAGYRVLMATHGEAGDAKGARRWWLECRKRLNEELGVSPSADTTALARRLGLEGGAATPQNRDDPAEADALGIPTVVIMPPAMLPGNELLDRFGLVVLEEITLGLSQFGSFRVIAAHTSWQLALRNRTDRDLSGLRFDYGVTIGIRSSHEPLRTTCRLTRLSTGEVLWTVQLEVGADNLQASLTELVRKTVSSLAAALERAEGRMSIVDPGSSGYRMYLEGKRSVGATGLESLRVARKWFRAAVKRCDEFSPAFAGLSRTLSMEWLVRGMTDRELLGEALAAARRAHACDPGSGRARRELGFTNLYLRRHDDSLAHFAEARSLSPHDADLLADYADALMHDGQAEKGLELIGSAKALNPVAPDYYRWIEATILYGLERYEDAIESLQPIASSPATARLMAASAAMAGDAALARTSAEVVREHYPDFRIGQIWGIVPDRRRADTGHFVRGLELAGLP